MDRIILLGSGGHAKSVVDAIEQSGKYEIAGFLERPEKQDFTYKGYQVIGEDDDMEKYLAQGVQYAFIAMGYMGNPTPREKLYRRLKGVGYQIPVIVDPTAVIAGDAVIEEGTFVGKQVVVNASAQVGKVCIINTGAIIEHECNVGPYTHVAVNAVLCGGVTVGRESLIGAGATIIQNVHVGDQAIVGAGSVVIRNVADREKVVGNPAGKIGREIR